MFSRGKLLVQMCVEDSNNKNGLPDKSSEIVTNTTNIQNSNNVDNNYFTMISVQRLFEDNPLDESSGIITNTMTIENSNADDDFIVEMQPVLQDISRNYVPMDNTHNNDAPSTSAGLFPRTSKTASMIANENQQNVSITDDLLSEDSSEDEYQPSHTASSFSDNDEEDTRHDGYDQGNSIIPNARKKKGIGRTKLTEETKSTKRKRNPTSWKRNKRHESKTKGLPYYSTANKFVPGKCLKPICSCKRKCGEEFPEDKRLNIFQHFYALDSNSQNQFIAQNFDVVEKKVERLRQSQRPSKRQFTILYFYTITGKIQVCRTMFLGTLDIKPGKVKVLAKKKRLSTSGICPDDKRGRHGHQPKISNEAISTIENHMKSFPSYISHYSRSHTDKQYLSQELTISKMYRFYIDYCAPQNIKPELESFYRKIYVENFNLSFHKPSNDTCAKCDKFKMLIGTTTDLHERTVHEKNYNQHLAMADQAYNEKKRDKIQSLNTENIVFLSFDLEKCLATPMLQNNVSFYKRSVWTYNLTIYSCVNKKKYAICYIFGVNH
ncbi:hypothetical protein JTB14_034210 [Gonioctena quinquepunctata]|nr:hypothetical protein JTB14_034210 [Gonioctena quinquepunctata]